MNTNWLLITGNPRSGFHYHGPFFTERAAYDYADYLCPEDFWVAPMTIERVEDQDEDSDSRHPMPD